MNGRVLIIAGSDSGGGAGIQADIKTVTALGGFATTAITALTAQNTTGVQAIHEVPADFVCEQIASVLDDIGTDAIKIGMLHRADVIEAVADILNTKAPETPLVVDPVMVATSGARLIKDQAAAVLISRLLPRADLLTPNAPEAAILSGISVNTTDDAEAAAQSLRATMGAVGRGMRGAMGGAIRAGAVLMKGGHLGGEQVIDQLFADGVPAQRFEGPRIDSRNTHGTGCTLASACATGLAQGLTMTAAVRRAHAYVRRAIETAPGYGSGSGPLNHGHAITAS